MVHAGVRGAPTACSAAAAAADDDDDIEEENLAHELT